MTEISTATPQPITMLAVREIICECLGVELEEVTPESNFVYDLGGESIDIIDLAFRLEKAFAVKVPFKALGSDALWQRDDSGRLTPAARELFRQALPFIDIEQVETTTGTLTAVSLLTVEVIYQMTLHAAGDRGGV